MLRLPKKGRATALSRIKEKLRRVTEQLEARERSEISDVAKEEPAARKVSGGLKHVTAHLRRSM
jgi:hypothetical protein